jgi:hypothetical protein
MDEQKQILAAENVYKMVAAEINMLPHQYEAL